MKRLPAAFYQLPSGREPVREWLKRLSDDDRKVIGADIKDVEKAQKTPAADLALALARMRELL